MPDLYPTSFLALTSCLPHMLPTFAALIHSYSMSFLLLHMFFKHSKEAFLKDKVHIYNLPTPSLQVYTQNIHTMELNPSHPPINLPNPRSRSPSNSKHSAHRSPPHHSSSTHRHRHSSSDHPRTPYPTFRRSSRSRRAQCTCPSGYRSSGQGRSRSRGGRLCRCSAGDC